MGIQIFKRGKTWRKLTCKYFAELLATDERTILRDISFIKRVLRIPIRFNQREKIYECSEIKGNPWKSLNGPNHLVELYANTFAPEPILFGDDAMLTIPIEKIHYIAHSHDGKIQGLDIIFSNIKGLRLLQRNRNGDASEHVKRVNIAL